MADEPAGPTRLARHGTEVFLGASLAALGGGAVAHLAGWAAGGDAIWAAATAVGAVAALWWVIDAARQGRLGADVIAVLALGGALAVGEVFAGAVITVMLATGRTLEARAGARARRELRALTERAPRVVHRLEGDQLTSPPIGDVVPGDLLLVQPGEVVPVDGLVVDEPAVLDESALTGEPLPVERAPGEPVRSGVVDAGGPFRLRATTTARDSTYAGIVRLVAEADAASSPFVRLADRYALAFLVVSVALAGLAWAVSGDAVRAVAVLVVATPCPLILAVPVAIVSGLSRAASRGVIVKGGATLERLAGGEVLLFDKTGTLTEGRPTLSLVIPADGPDDGDAGSAPGERSGAGTDGSRTGGHRVGDPDEILRLAASVDQMSPHVLAGAVVRAARQRGLELTLPTAVEEIPARGVSGDVDGHRVVVGKGSWVVPGPPPPWTRAVRRRADLDGALTVFVGVDGTPAGALVFEDPIRIDAARTIRQLRRDGISRIVMVTGDRDDVAQTVGAVIGLDAVLAERTPAEKVDAVREEGRTRTTIMVGDGVNDAPALALADVGVAIGSRGATASSEAADVVLTVDRLDRLGDAVVIARRARRIARQSVGAGIGLSLAAMVAAAFGLLPPAYGAVLQEVIDLAVIANALRVLRVRGSATALPPEDMVLVEQFSGEHRALRPDLDRLREAADLVGTAPPARSLAAARAAHALLVEEILPHEEAEDTVLYPVFARMLGGADPTGTMSRAHVEISHLVRRLGRLLDEIDPADPDPEDLLELRRVLYGLHAILELHFTQEDESYLSMVDEAERPVAELPTSQQGG